METTRFDSRVVQNLRVTGALDNNGKQTVLKRCWATFKVTENASATPNATPAIGHRGSFTPMRIYDYETKKGFAPPANATIVAVSVVGKTEADHEKLTTFRTSIGTATQSNGFALGVMRSPNPDTDTVASRDCTIGVVTGITAGTVTTVTLDRSASNTRDVATQNNDVCNPYEYYYKYLSPNQAVPALFHANKHIGVCQEYADRTLTQYTGAIRIPWGAPPATANNGKNLNSVVTANPGLSLFITSQNPTTATISQNQQILLVATADITLDVVVELEFDENTDLLADNSVAFSNLELQSQTV